MLQQNNLQLISLIRRMFFCKPRQRAKAHACKTDLQKGPKKKSNLYSLMFLKSIPHFLSRFKAESESDCVFRRKQISYQCSHTLGIPRVTHTLVKHATAEKRTTHSRIQNYIRGIKPFERRTSVSKPS